MQSIDSKILSRIYGRGKGCVVTPSDFLDLGSRQAVDLTLHRLVKKGTLRRLTRGLYDYPRIDPDIGFLSPTTDAWECPEGTRQYPFTAVRGLRRQPAWTLRSGADEDRISHGWTGTPGTARQASHHAQTHDPPRYGIRRAVVRLGHPSPAPYRSTTCG